MKYILGVDGGGTKTVALLGDLNGNVLARGSSGPSNYHAVGFDAACSALENAIQKARDEHPGEISAICLGLAGAGREVDIERFTNWAIHKFPNAKVKTLSDGEVLLMAGASSGPALALVCGTGSIVYGRTMNGEILRAGGWGYLFGDEGSGFAIGEAALKSVMRAFDGRGAPTLLSELVLERQGLQSPPELVNNIYGAESPRGIIASLAEVVEQAAERTDDVAIGILEKAAEELASTVRVIYSKLETSPVPLVVTGKTILYGKQLRDKFNRACQAQGMIFASVHDVEEPAEGALQLAWQLALDDLKNAS
jgi:N-acetylglucosamine kinase-like BadF-type ATPase